jgi:hypothetical protein
LRDTDKHRPRTTDLLRDGYVERVAGRGPWVVAVLLAQVDRVMRGCASPQSLAEQQDQTVESEEAGRGKWLREDHAQRVLEGKSQQAGRDGCNDEQPRESFVRGLDATPPDRREEAADDAQPVLPVEDEQSKSGGHVQAHNEREVGRLAA